MNTIKAQELVKGDTFYPVRKGKEYYKVISKDGTFIQSRIDGSSITYYWLHSEDVVLVSKQLLGLDFKYGKYGKESR